MLSEDWLRLEGPPWCFVSCWPRQCSHSRRACGQHSVTEQLNKQTPRGWNALTRSSTNGRGMMNMEDTMKKWPSHPSCFEASQRRWEKEPGMKGCPHRVFAGVNTLLAPYSSIQFAKGRSSVGDYRTPKPLPPSTPKAQEPQETLKPCANKPCSEASDVVRPRVTVALRSGLCRW